MPSTSVEIIMTKTSSGEKWDVSVKAVEIVNASKVPLARVTLSLYGMSGITGSTGMMMFPDIPVGTHQITATKDGYDPVSYTLPLLPN